MFEHIDIRITSEGSVFIVEQNDTIRRKQIEPQSLLQLIKNSIDKNEVVDKYGSPALPKNCIYYGVLERFASSPTQVVVIERDKCSKPYNHIGDIILNVGYPKLLFAYKIQNNNVISSAVVAAKDEFIKNNSAVYHFPYGNVFADGIICWGNYRHPQLEELANLTFYPELFYLIEHTHPTNAVGQAVVDLLHKGKKFDDSKLVLMTTFKKFINQFTNSKGGF
ncbi:hypothetical protein IT084_10440 [Desulfallas sp. Bu1-1]|uniref:hypothetical protein n=1 Tax=Desulfallas sp. Bu1-1 TaxID=2787620 RepID=UPI00189E022A|nr:hypothetical protein [Desulfallas sp. Bu1-1]MBF7083391.1 hypothetical protein [Desulfallas sp. Bu1-1]